MTHPGIRSRQIAVVALAIGAYFTAQTAMMSYAARGRVDLEWDVAQELLYWAVWAALAPVIMSALSRWPVPVRSPGRAIAVHAVVGPLLAVAQTSVAFGAHFVVLHLAGAIPASELWPWIARVRPSLVWGAFMGTFLYAVVVGADAALRVRRLYAGAQAEVLRSQLRPHFIFNTLNAIAVLTTEEPRAARQMLIRLGTLLRRTFEETPREVPLTRELEYLGEYLEIQRARFGSRLNVSVSVDDGVANAIVPAFLLQPLVENAMEHAVAVRDQPTIVTLRAERAGDRLRIVVEDNGPGPSDAGLERQGIGLRNTRALLAQLYGSASSVTLRAVRSPSAGGTAAEVILPFAAAAV